MATHHRRIKCTEHRNAKHADKNINGEGGTRIVPQDIVLLSAEFGKA